MLVCEVVLVFIIYNSNYYDKYISLLNLNFNKSIFELLYWIFQ